MKLHHAKHHQTYVTNLNVAEEKLHEATSKGDVKQQIVLQPGARFYTYNYTIQAKTACNAAIKFNGGGHINHSIFWTNLIGQKQGGGELSKGII